MNKNFRLSPFIVSSSFCHSKPCTKRNEIKELKSFKKQVMVDIYTEIGWIKHVLKGKVDMEKLNITIFHKSNILLKSCNTQNIYRK